MIYSVFFIGYICFCFMEKFVILCQLLFVLVVWGILELLLLFDQVEVLEGLEQVSYIWLLFFFYQVLEDKLWLKVCLLCLGGNCLLGVFVICVIYWLNGIGQLVVCLEGFEVGCLWLFGIDLFDGILVFDIKFYVFYVDVVVDVCNGIVDVLLLGIVVEWSEQVWCQVYEYGQWLWQLVVELIE